MLDKYYAIYVPTTYEVDKKINNKPFVKIISSKMAELFGGATIYNADGAWLAKNKKLVNEKITIVKSYCDNDTFIKNEGKIKKIAYWLCEAMKQEAVSVETSQGLQFISK